MLNEMVSIKSAAWLSRLFVSSAEFMVVAAVVALIVFVARIKSHRVIALLWLVAIAKPLISLVAGSPVTIVPIAAPITVPLHHIESRATSERTIRNITVEKSLGINGQEIITETITDTAVAPPARTPIGATTLTTTGTIAGVWMLGVIAILTLSIAGRIRLRRLIQNARAPDAALNRLFGDVCGQIGISAGIGAGAGTRPRLLVTDALESPALAGSIRPVVLLPRWMADEGDKEQLQWSLKHELMHRKLRDPWSNMMCEVARTIFWFHPVVWWAITRWRRAAEMACDEALVHSNQDARAYAGQLYEILRRVQSRRRLHVANAMFATRTEIGKRIELLLSRSRAPRRNLLAVALLFVFGATTLSVGADVIAPANPGNDDVINFDVTMAGMRTTTGDRSRWTMNLHEVNDQREVKMSARGELRFDGDAIGWISFDGYFKLEETADGTTRDLKITSTKDATLNYRYRIDGKATRFDEDAQRWFEQRLREARRGDISQRSIF